MTTLIEQIYNHILSKLEQNNIEDNTENRYYALQSFRSALEESANNDIDITLYLLAINTELMSLQFKLGAI